VRQNDPVQFKATYFMKITYQ